MGAGRAVSGCVAGVHDGSEEQLDDNHLMRMAGRFARRVKARGAASEVPVIYCKSGERKHRIAEEYWSPHDIVQPGIRCGRLTSVLDRGQDDGVCATMVWIIHLHHATLKLIAPRRPGVRAPPAKSANRPARSVQPPNLAAPASST